MVALFFRFIVVVFPLSDPAETALDLIRLSPIVWSVGAVYEEQTHLGLNIKFAVLLLNFFHRRDLFPAPSRAVLIGRRTFTCVSPSQVCMGCSPASSRHRRPISGCLADVIIVAVARKSY